MKQSKKLVTVACIGTVLEWAEFTFYAYIATKISLLFFPNMDHQSGVIAAFVVFAIGYLMRPLGAVLFGFLGDRFGRRSALQASIVLMGLSAVCIGLLPSYQAIGAWAPLLLLLFRCLQGLAVSGEFNGSSIFLMEHARGKLYFAASWTGWAAAIGMMVGSLAALLVALPGVASWAWRIPFLSGAVICVCGFYVRKKFDETPEFLDLLTEKTLQRFPLMQVFRHNWRQFMVATMLAAVTGIYIYVANVFYATHLIKSGGLLSYQAKLVVTIGTVFVILIFPFAAQLADRCGGKRIMRIGLVLMIVAGPLLYLVPLTHSLLLMIIMQLPYAIADALLCAPIFRTVNQLFPANVRYSGASFSWSVSMAVFGGTAPLISTWLQSWTRLSYAPAIYIVVAAFAGLLVLRYISCVSEVGSSAQDLYGEKSRVTLAR